MIRLPPRSTRTDTLSLPDALPIAEAQDRCWREPRHHPVLLRPRRLPALRRPRAGGGHQGADRPRRPADRELRAHAPDGGELQGGPAALRSEEHTSELQSLMRISYAVFCLKKKKKETVISTQ